MNDASPNLDGRLLPPRLRVRDGGSYAIRSVWCVGRNYRAHTIEMGTDPDRNPPLFFAKPASAIVCDPGAVAYPPRTTNLQHEVELVVAIGRAARNVTATDALGCVAGYAVGIDLTRRCAQSEAKEGGRPWALAKGFDGSGPCSEITAAAEFQGFATAEIRLSVNGQRRQHSTLDKQIWSVAEVIAELSSIVGLEPGDLIFTGTPAGVGPLVVGDEVLAEIVGLRPLRLRVEPQNLSPR